MYYYLNVQFQGQRVNITRTRALVCFGITFSGVRLWFKTISFFFMFEIILLLAVTVLISVTLPTTLGGSWLSLSHHDQFLLQRAMMLLLKPLRTEHHIDRCSLASLRNRCSTLCSFRSLQGNSSQSWVLYRLQSIHCSYKYPIQCFHMNLHTVASSSMQYTVYFMKRIEDDILVLLSAVFEENTKNL